MVELSKKADDWFSKIQKYLGQKINAFAAFMFLLIAIGALFALIVSSRWPQHSALTVLGPAIAGIIAYKNRAFAIGAIIIALILILL